MKAVDVLMEEHRVIERVLAALRAAAEHLQQGRTVDPIFFVDAVDFIRGFADGCHHQKEEGVLFPALTDAGMPTAEGPIAVMLADHAQARVYAGALLEAAEGMRAGDATATVAATRNALDYVALLEEHISKEDNMLFPMANEVIAASEQERVDAEVARVQRKELEDGVHERYVVLVEKLERQLAS
jgi:hemerythrin-like domain-containing protein